MGVAHLARHVIKFSVCLFCRLGSGVHCFLSQSWPWCVCCLLGVGWSGWCGCLGALVCAAAGACLCVLSAVLHNILSVSSPTRHLGACQSL